jgi:hypothetical protein
MGLIVHREREMLKMLSMPVLCKNVIDCSYTVFNRERDGIDIAILLP